VGDTCAMCVQDTDCSGATDYCVTDPSDFNGYCAPDCTTGTCANMYACSPESDSSCANSTGTGTTGGTSGGVIPVGDTCSICTYDSDCSGPDDWCIVDPVSGNGYCAPDCTTGTCSSGYTCFQGQDADPTNGQTEDICYPNSETCVSTGTSSTSGSGSGTGSGSGSSSGSSSGGSNTGSSCTTGTDCTSGYCHDGVCTCNCGGGVYQCVSTADCCTGPGQGNTCSSDGFSTGCVNNVCF
jgi:hypothetical protein